MSTLRQLPGIKIGMTQVFDAARNVIPVTVIECGQWIVTQVKTVAHDGYDALQIGYPKKQYQGEAVQPEWFAKKAEYFAHVREVTVESVAGYEQGQSVSLANTAWDSASVVAVTGSSKGKGFQGVVKRWGFAGGPKSHGSMFHRRPGGIGNMSTQGNVLKGKKLPGHCGDRTVTVRGLSVVSVDTERGVILVKGAVPGKKNTLLCLSQQSK